MPSYNKIMLIGNLTKDPELKSLPSGTSIATFGLAVNHRYRTAAGEDREEVCFVDCAAFGGQADTIANWCRKGKPLFVEGRLKFASWESTSGDKRSRHTVVVENFQFLGSRDPAGGLSEQVQDRPLARQQPQRTGNGSAQPRQSSGRPPAQAPAEQPFGDEHQFQEADIPF